MNEKEMWLKLVCSAAAGYSVPDGSDFDMDDLIDDVADVAEGFANEMLDRFEAKFGPIQTDGERRPTKRARGKGRSRGKPTPAED